MAENKAPAYSLGRYVRLNAEFFFVNQNIVFYGMTRFADANRIRRWMEGPPPPRQKQKVPVAITGPLNNAYSALTPFPRNTPDRMLNLSS
jgi:hypothetical protein